MADIVHQPNLNSYATENVYSMQFNGCMDIENTSKIWSLKFEDFSLMLSPLNTSTFLMGCCSQFFCKSFFILTLLSIQWWQCRKKSNHMHLCSWDLISVSLWTVNVLCNIVYSWRTMYKHIDMQQKNVCTWNWMIV